MPSVSRFSATTPSASARPSGDGGQPGLRAALAHLVVVVVAGHHGVAQPGVRVLADQRGVAEQVEVVGGSPRPLPGADHPALHVGHAQRRVQPGDLIVSIACRRGPVISPTSRNRSLPIDWANSCTTEAKYRVAPEVHVLDRVDPEAVEVGVPDPPAVGAGQRGQRRPTGGSSSSGPPPWAMSLSPAKSPSRYSGSWSQSAMRPGRSRCPGCVQLGGEDGAVRPGASAGRPGQRLPRVPSPDPAGPSVPARTKGWRRAVPSTGSGRRRRRRRRRRG